MNSTELNSFIINILPNPTSAGETMYIQSSTDIIIQSAELYNSTGIKVSSHFRSNEIDTSHLAKGLYLLEIISNKGNITKKILIN